MLTRAGSLWRSQKATYGARFKITTGSPNTPAALQRLVRKLGHEGVKLRFSYEAGP
jgi:hypothetical protein